MNDLSSNVATIVGSNAEKDYDVSSNFRDDVNLKFVMGYDFQALIDRMVDKFGWNELDATQAFKDMKMFLYLCGASTEGQPFAPSENIDELWHNFILFTEEYNSFCRQYFGRFIHHRPRRRNDMPSKGHPIQHTLLRARQIFGDLSSNWQFKGNDGILLADCSPSTNCQDSDCHDSK